MYTFRKGVRKQLNKTINTMYLIYDLNNKVYVTKRKNVSYSLFTEDLKNAKFYKNYKNAEIFARQIMENNKLLNADLKIVKISYRE